MRITKPKEYRCQWRCRIVHKWRFKSVHLTNLKQEFEGCGDVKDRGIFHDPRSSSKRIEHQPNIAGDRISPGYGSEIYHCTHNSHPEEEKRAIKQT